MARRKPTIDQIVYASGRRSGRPVKRLRPADVVIVDGSGFGNNADDCVVLFDDVEATPHALGFSSGSFVLSVPLPPASTDSVRVRVGKRVSDAIECRLVRPGRARRAPGSEIRAYYAELDQFATLTAATATFLAPSTVFPAELRQAASMINGYRASMQLMSETVGQFAAVQDTLDIPQNFDAVRSIRLLDEHLRACNAVGELAAMSRLMYGPDGRLEMVLAGSDVHADQVLSGRGPTGGSASVSTDDAALFGFSLHEVTKALEGVEDLFDLAQPSFSIGAGAEADVTIDIGGIASAFAKVLDLTGQYLMRGQEDATARAVALIDLKIDRLEGKLDRLDTKLDGLIQVIGSINEQVGAISMQLVDLATAVQVVIGGQAQLEEKADRTERALDRLEGKADLASAERNSLIELVGLLEGKADASAIQLVRQEEKLDRQELKADIADQKLDSLEAKADRAEPKLDAVEVKLDLVEPKLDAVEVKLDLVEPKLDAVEVKLDLVEPKLDALEVKADRTEEKLDRQEVKLDRLDQPAPLEGTVAAQRGGSRNITAAVAATDTVDNSVNIRAAVDTAPARLDQKTAWSPWIDFGRPQTAAGILETSIDLAYADRSNRTVSGLLSARDQSRRVFHRSLESRPDTAVIDPDEWSDWQSFLDQP